MKNMFYSSNLGLISSLNNVEDVTDFIEVSGLVAEVLLNEGVELLD
jgi:hypothetical protein